MSDQTVDPARDVEPGYIHTARYFGADAALSAATWIEGMSEADARSILDDIDPAVLDRYPEPNLSGEFAGDETPWSLARDVVGWPEQPDAEMVDAIATAWEEGRDRVWSDALQAHALRTLGRIADAQRVESELERQTAELRKAADR